MSHEMFRLARASEAQLDLIMAGAVFIAVLAAGFIVWFSRQDKRRRPGADRTKAKHRKRRPRGSG